MNSITFEDLDNPVKLDKELLSTIRTINTSHSTFHSSFFSCDSFPEDSFRDYVSSVRSIADQSLDLNNLSEDDEIIKNREVDEDERNDFFLAMKHEASVLTQLKYEDDDTDTDHKMKAFLHWVATFIKRIIKN